MRTKLAGWPWGLDAEDGVPAQPDGTSESWKSHYMPRFLRDNSLGLAMFGLFAIFLVAQSITGWHVFNDDHREHSEATVEYVDYLRTGHFVEATFENWQSEFLAVFSLVVLSIVLRQRGSPESKPVAASHVKSGE